MERALEFEAQVVFLWMTALKRKFATQVLRPGSENIDEFGDWQCKSIAIEVARQGVEKEHWVEKVQLRAKECKDQRNLSINVGSIRFLIF